MPHFQLGDYSYLGEKTFVNSCTRTDAVVVVGKYTSISWGVNFMIDFNHNLHYMSTFPFKEKFGCDVPLTNWGKENPVVGNDVWIGHNVTVYSGVTIGDGAVVAGNSVVTKSVPPYAVVAGNPARLVKYRFSHEIIDKFLKLKWWDLPFDVINKELCPHFTDIPKLIEALEKIRNFV